jgi:excisionase family DNA binding protein
MPTQTANPVEALARTSLLLANEVLATSQRAAESANAEVLTLPEVATLLRVSESAIRQLVVIGEIPGRLIGGEWRFLRNTILSWLAGGDSPRRRNASGWKEDAAFPKEEWRSAPAMAAWGEETRKEAEDFIKQVRAARQATVTNPNENEQ